MSDERELERHLKVLEQIKNAKTKKELPKVEFSTITSYLASNIYFNNRKLSQTLFQPVVNEIVYHGHARHIAVKQALLMIILFNYENLNAEEVANKCASVLKSKRIDYILEETQLKKAKLDEFEKNKNEKNHKQILKDIKSSFEIKELPKIGLSELNKKLVNIVNDNDFVTNIKASEINDLTIACLNNSNYSELEIIVDKICSKYNLNYQNKMLMKEQILGSLILDETIKYIVEEINTKEKRKLDISRLNHEETMQNIKDATRISQLPSSLNSSTITSYLNGNTTIYTKDDRVTADDLKRITELLLEGYKFDGMFITNEVIKIAKEKYPEKEDAFVLLYDKLSSLPRTEYLVEEVKFAMQRQKEFIGRGSNNVNVYFIPNEKSPIDGGRFYNCYINRVDNLDLEKILPLDLSTIVPPEMDIDSIEWYVQQNVDKTFKTAGGIILNKDETIGNVSIFKPNDGKIGVSLEEKEKIDEIDSLDETINEKKALLEQLKIEIEKKQNESTNAEEKIKKLVSNYERKALEFQKELIESVKKLQEEFSISEEETIRTRKNNMV